MRVPLDDDDITFDSEASLIQFKAGDFGVKIVVLILVCKELLYGLGWINLVIPVFEEERE